MHDEDDIPSGSGQGSGGSRHKRYPLTPRSPWFPRMPQSPLGPLKEKNIASLEEKNGDLMGKNEGEGGGKKTITPILQSPKSPGITNAPSPLSTLWEHHKIEGNESTSKPTIHPPILTVPDSDRFHHIQSATPPPAAPSPTSIRFAPQPFQTQRLLSSSSRLHEHRGRQSLDLGPLPAFHPPPLSRSSSDPQRRKTATMPLPHR